MTLPGNEPTQRGDGDIDSGIGDYLPREEVYERESEAGEMGSPRGATIGTSRSRKEQSKEIEMRIEHSSL